MQSVDFSYANVITTEQGPWEEVSALISREHRKLPQVSTAVRWAGVFLIIQWLPINAQ